MTINPALFSSDNEHFCTPPNVLDPIYKFKSIALDPCSNDGSLVISDKKYTKEDNGLILPWTGNGELTFCNPPYGREIPKWVSKCVAERKLGAEILFLVPFRAGAKTSWQGENGIIRTSSLICAWNGRLQFYDHRTGQPAKIWSKKKQQWVNSVAPFNSALVYWGDDEDRFIEIFKEYGEIMRSAL